MKWPKIISHQRGWVANRVDLPPTESKEINLVWHLRQEEETERNRQRKRSCVEKDTLTVYLSLRLFVIMSDFLTIQNQTHSFFYMLYFFPPPNTLIPLSALIPPREVTFEMVVAGSSSLYQFLSQSLLWVTCTRLCMHYITNRHVRKVKGVRFYAIIIERVWKCLTSAICLPVALSISLHRGHLINMPTKWDIWHLKHIVTDKGRLHALDNQDKM